MFDFVGESVILANILNFNTLDHNIMMLLLGRIRVLHIANKLLI
jgi:hypothetical protein